MSSAAFYQTVGGIMGFTGVACGALGAHALKTRGYSADKVNSWNIATKYQLMHAVLIFCTSLYGQTKGAKTPMNALRLWTIGTTLFSGSIYALVLGAPGFPFGPITPVGGLIMMAGWLCAAFGY
eukprot:GFYU01067954.1.p1 GENE.GFYU01067954.1~~GFYU01067954.1.p1  ORF type:complete len:124 (+),score=17.94 GFYU01067954.1:155-526(+)